MSDLIERQKAIDALIALHEAHKADQFTGDLLHWTGIKAMLETIPSAEPERKWIPVTEALPEEDEEVLVTVRFDGTKDVKSSVYVEVANRIGDEWTSYSDEYKVARRNHHVIAWMPLPEPWRGDR